MKTIIMVALIATGCVTANENKVREIETKNVVVKGSLGNGKVVLNSDDEIVIQEETDADNELRIQEAVNSKIQSDLNQEAHMLKRCRMDLSDERLGGSGKIPELPAVDSMKDAEDVKEELGLNEDGELKVVKRSYFVARLKAARKYERSLRKMLSTVENHREECEYKMGQARVKAGLPAERYEAQGYFIDGGVWVQTRKGEKSLSDAIEIQAEKTADQ